MRLLILTKTNINLYILAPYGFICGIIILCIFIEIIISILESYNIPYFKKTEGTGGVMEIYAGYNNYGINLYVQPEMLQTAKELINPDNIEDNI